MGISWEGMGGSSSTTSASPPEVPPNSDSWPAARSLRRREAWLTAAAIVSSMPRRVAPVQSRAPARTRLSSARLLTWAWSTRRQKSQSDSNGPPASRAEMMAATAFSPTPLVAVRPKRISRSPVTAKSERLTLTSGGSTDRPMSVQQAT